MKSTSESDAGYDDDDYKDYDDYDNDYDYYGNDYDNVV